VSVCGHCIWWRNRRKYRTVTWAGIFWDSASLRIRRSLLDGNSGTAPAAVRRFFLMETALESDNSCCFVRVKLRCVALLSMIVPGLSARCLNQNFTSQREPIVVISSCIFLLYPLQVPHSDTDSFLRSNFKTTAEAVVVFAALRVDDGN
jgi:hypothetical protein